MSLQPSDPTEHRLCARLELTNFTVEQEAARRALARAQGQLRISLAEVEAANSLLLALLVDLTRQAQARSLALEFTHVPATVLAMVAFSGLDDLLPLAVR